MTLAVKPPGSSVSFFSQAHALLQKGQFCFCFSPTSGFYRLVILLILFHETFLTMLKLLKHTENLQRVGGRKLDFCLSCRSRLCLVHGSNHKHPPCSLSLGSCVSNLPHPPVPTTLGFICLPEPEVYLQLIANCLKPTMHR